MRVTWIAVEEICCHSLAARTEDFDDPGKKVIELAVGRRPEPGVRYGTTSTRFCLPLMRMPEEVKATSLPFK